MPESDSDDDFRPVLLSRQGGCVVELICPGVVRKRGRRVTRNERAALRIVESYTNVPVPKDGEEVGSILMEHIGGHTLKSVWDSFDSTIKERICFDIWAIIEQLRRIPKPPGAYQFGADGSASRDVLLKDLEVPPRPIADDAALRARINERYLHENGGSYREHLPDFLPHSDIAVFTHGDIAPRNIMVNDSGSITGLIDWENSGWYPDYWEYANIQKPSADEDWMAWMDQTKPTNWDITGITKARRVLF
ncbi:hypothetical protein K449DRAFT_405600 [Hypoxylon sp. EC38]|nr:hypothetical protein K449DRAFT_405600 [Hypoxylon sp. EC38]